MDETPIKSVLSLVESAIKLFVALGAVLYGFGFIAVAVHYSRYNVTSLSLLNTDYVVAGLLCIVPLAVLCVITAGVYSRLSDKTEGCLKKFGMALGGLSILVLILLSVLGRNSSSLNVFLFVIIILVIAGVFYLALQGIFNNDREAAATAAAATVLWVVPSLVIYTLLFAYYIYPKIPRAIGGGKPATVRFTLKELPVQSGTNSTNQTGQSSPPKNVDPTVLLQWEGTNNRITILYKLLLATDKTYVIQQSANDKSTYEFPKDAVTGIIFYAE